MISGTAIYTITKEPNTENLNSMYADIDNLTDKITLYYAQNGKLPILKDETVTLPSDAGKNLNDNENYYVIDLSQLEDVSLKFGRDYAKYKEGKEGNEDVYVVNEKSHQVYYLKGINFKGTNYYTASYGNSKIEYTGKTDGTYDTTKCINTPKINEKNGMELVVYENGKWVKDNNKYSYNYVAGEGVADNTESKWANAKVTVDGVDSYFVWIPRYAYKITYYTNAELTTPSENNAKTTNGRIDVVFLKDKTDKYIDENGEEKTASRVNKGGDPTKDYVVHPAFTDDVNDGGWDEELEGIWVGKYETSLYDKTNKQTVSTDNETAGNILLENTDKVLAVQPNVSSWRYCTMGNMYTNARNYSPNLESHMLKNSEWGAVAYLTHSQYGRNGHEIAVNTSDTYITGSEGDKASSTGNSYGIYDLSGGAYERVAAYYSEKSSLDVENLSDATKTSDKYSTVYNGTDENTSYKKGDATYETKEWNSDKASFVDSSNPVFRRSQNYAEATNHGTFCYYGGDSLFHDDSTFRMCLVIE